MSNIGEALDLAKEAHEYKATNKLKYYRPYPYQLNFHSLGIDHPQRLLMAANRVGKCNTISVYIDTDKGKKKISDIFGTECRVLTWPDLEPRKVKKWIRKPPEECFRIIMKNGEWVEVPKGHLILTDGGFQPVSSVFEQLPESVFYHHLSNSVFSRLIHVSGVLNFARNIRDYLDDCSLDYRLDDARLLSDEDNVQVFAPSLNGVLKHKGFWSYAGGLVNRYKRNLSQFFSRLSNLYDDHLIWGQYVGCEDRVSSFDAQRMILNNQTVQQFSISGHHCQPSGEVHFHRKSVFSSVIPVIEGNYIVSIYSVGVKQLYDMEVDERHNYVSGGLVHHNTICGAAELAFHLTGIYPDWWRGRVFKKPIKAWAAGINNDKTRDIVQASLCGSLPEDWGKGFIPKDCLGETMRKPGVPNALQQVLVKHISGGWSMLGFKSYEMEAVGFYGESIDCVWLDEEPNQSIYSQSLTRVVDRAGLVFMTFTPEMGVTQVVASFMNDLKSGQALIHATWEDVSEEKGGHLNRVAMDQILSAYHPSERDLRTKGVPVLGSGLVYPVSEDSILVDPFPIPDYYKVIAGLDPGDDHPTAVSWIAHNVDTDTIYVYDAYRERRQDIIYHASAIKTRGKWITVAWPHDAMRKNGYGGPALADMYRSQGVKMHWEKFTNPPSLGETEGKGGNEIMPGIQEILTRMRTGRFKIFRTLAPWLEEFRMYHLDPKTGKPVDKGDDLMQATRYAVQSLRWATTKKYSLASTDKIVYKNMGIV